MVLDPPALAPHILIAPEADGTLRVTFPPRTVLEEGDAPIFIDALRTAMAQAPDGCARALVDMRNSVGATPEYRSAIGSFLRANKDRVRIACYHQNAFMSAMILLVAKATGTPLRAFRSEREAREWLGRP